MADFSKYYYMKNEFTPKEASVIRSLEQALERYHIPSVYYSTNGYKEESVCLSKNGDKWEVYVAERGMQRDKMEYRSIMKVADELIRRLTDSADTYQKISEEFKNRTKRKQFEIIHFKHALVRTNPYEVLVRACAYGKKPIVKMQIDPNTIKKSLIDYDNIRVGDRVRVCTRSQEKMRETKQTFEGKIVAKRNKNNQKTITVRKISNGVGIEKDFFIDSSDVVSVECLHRRSDRRAKFKTRKSKEHKNSKLKGKS